MKKSVNPSNVSIDIEHIEENLSDIETEKLFHLYKETNEKIFRDELIERHIYIAEILSKKYLNRGIDYEDIFQVASLGLIYAVKRFDIDRGFKFSSFATPTIIGEIKKHFRDKGWTLRVPRRIQELSKKINLAKSKLQQELKRIPTVNDIAEYLDVTEEAVIEAMEASHVYNPKSLDMTYNNSDGEKDINLLDLVGQDDKYFEYFENEEFIDKCLSKLNDVERKIINDRFYEMKTQIVIAEELNVSQMTISRMEKKIIEKLKKEYEKLRKI